MSTAPRWCRCARAWAASANRASALCLAPRSCAGWKRPRGAEEKDGHSLQGGVWVRGAVGTAGRDGVGNRSSLLNLGEPRDRVQPRARVVAAAVDNVRSGYRALRMLARTIV